MFHMNKKRFCKEGCKKNKTEQEMQLHHMNSFIFQVEHAYNIKLTNRMLDKRFCKTSFLK